MLNRHSQINNTQGGQIDSNFEVIITFDYSDGPEFGLAMYTSGDGVRFSSVGDSKTRLERGFKMELIEGNWLPQVKELMEQEGVLKPRRVIVPGPSKTIESLKKNVMEAAAKKRFVAVGTPDLMQLSSIEVSEREISQLDELSTSFSGYEMVKNLI